MSVQAFFKGKTLLITGCTGFVGKVLLEKILRSLPEVNLIYVLIRQKKGSSLMERFKREILGSQCYDRLRNQIGSQFDDYIQQKVKPVEGDLIKENLGINKLDLQEIIENAHIVINCAASVDFNCRLDEAIQVNFQGTKHVFELSQRIVNLQNFVHISTCYVNSNKHGWIEEKIYGDNSDPLEIVEKLLKIPINVLEASTQDIIGGFPNTYTFTKNLTERMLSKLRPKGFPLTIVRPSIVGASLSEPIPGWIDSIVASAAIYFFSGLGLIKTLYGDENLIGDQIPVDTVVNFILVAAAFNACKEQEVYHVSSSASNPVSWKFAKDIVVEYWNKNRTEQRIASCRVSFEKNKRIYNLKQQTQLVPAKIFERFAQTCGSKNLQMQSKRLMKMIRRADEINKTFEYFINNQWIFDTNKTQQLINYLTGPESELFMIDVQQINWRSYLLTFNYGLQRFILKESVQPFNLEQNDLLQMNKSSYFSDIEWAMNQGVPFKTKITNAHISLVMNSSRVCSVIKQLVEQKAQKLKGRGPVNIEKIQHDFESEGLEICNVMFANYKMPVLRGFAWFLTKVFRRIYDKVVIDDASLKRIQEHDIKKNGPLIIMPTHRSYIDFLMCSFVFFAYRIKCPHIATAEDFLKMAIIPTLLRCSGAFFLKRKSIEDSPLYKAIFYEYVQRLLLDECYLEFFIEGTRSRSGKTLFPKFGLLSIVNDAVHDGKLVDASILPLAITYEKVLEADTYPYELLGEEKVKESLIRVIKAARILSINFGRIYINFAPIISVKNFSLQNAQNLSMEQIQQNPQVRKDITVSLAYKIIYSMIDSIVVMPTSMVSTLLLMHRRGVSEDDLIKKMEWLTIQLHLRGAKTATLHYSQVDAQVRNSINLLSEIIIKSKKNIFELQVSPNLDYKNILLLSYYRNQLMHVFVQEGIICCALSAFGHQISFKEGVKAERLWEETEFLLNLLKREFVLQNQIRTYQDFLNLIGLMVKRQVLTINNGMIKVADKNGELTLQFLCSLIWPLIESYWVTLVYLYQIGRNKNSIALKKLIQQIQWFAETLLEERVMEHYESCSQETIKNAVSIYKDMNIINIDKDSHSDEDMVRSIVDEIRIIDVENQLKKFLKNAFVISIHTPFDIAKKTMIVDYQFIPKL